MRARLADELADTACHLALLANEAGVDLDGAIRSKFNRVCERRSGTVEVVFDTPSTDCCMGIALGVVDGELICVSCGTSHQHLGAVQALYIKPL